MLALVKYFKEPYPHVNLEGSLSKNDSLDKSTMPNECIKLTNCIRFPSRIRTVPITVFLPTVYRMLAPFSSVYEVKSNVFDPSSSSVCQ